MTFNLSNRIEQTTRRRDSVASVNAPSLCHRRRGHQANVLQQRVERSMRLPHTVAA